MKKFALVLILYLRLWWRRMIVHKEWGALNFFINLGLKRLLFWTIIIYWRYRWYRVTDLNFDYWILFCGACTLVGQWKVCNHLCRTWWWRLSTDWWLFCFVRCNGSWLSEVVDWCLPLNVWHRCLLRFVLLLVGHRGEDPFKLVIDWSSLFRRSQVTLFVHIFKHAADVDVSSASWYCTDVMEVIRIWWFKLCEEVFHESSFPGDLFKKGK